MGVGRVIESYLIRRAVLGLTTQNYNRLFLQVTRALQQSGFTARALAQELASVSGGTGWPSDEAFQEAWMTQHIYHVMNNPRLVHVLKRLSDAFQDNRTGHVTVEGQLTVEHLLPQSWLEHWPLPDGSRGLTYEELISADRDDLRAAQTRERNQALHNHRELDDPAAGRELMGVERAVAGKKTKDSIDVVASHQSEFAI